MQKFAETIEVIIYIASNSGENLVRGKEISASKNLPPRHFEPILQLLVKEKILKGVKGPKGGYCLAKEKRKITLGDIYRILLKQYEWDESSVISKEIVNPLIKKSMDDISRNFDKITIESLCQSNKKIPMKQQDKNNFTI